MSLEQFHPSVRAWFSEAFTQPTATQTQAWPRIRAGRDALIAAPTGSGKTLAAFLAAIDELVTRGLSEGLPDEVQVVYVSPLKALSNDIQRNLEAPLAGIRAQLSVQGFPDLEIRSLVRTGDTPQAQRQLMRRRPPHILVTTPESLYILVTSKSGREMLSTVRTVIVDEIHALAPSKRGAHLALTLERMGTLGGPPFVRVGLSATQKPIEEVARFLVGSDRAMPVIVDSGHVRARDLAIEVPPSPLEAVMSGEVWQQVYDRLTELIAQHRTTLIFANTRRLAERVARHLSERLGDTQVTSHHGSLAREQRLNAEQRLKRGELKALVATASLELGIDIGDVDLVCQLGTPRSISTFLQRVGRSGHAVSGTPKGRLFALSRDDLVECTALLDCVRRAELDRLSIPSEPLDVLAQQLVAEVACREWKEDELFDLVRRAYPYKHLPREKFSATVEMLADGFHTRRGRRNTYLHRDAIHRELRARRGAALTSVTSGGTIPDLADYSVVLEPQSLPIGTVHEDFAIESLAGDVFQLGNHSYRILRVERGLVRVEDAQGTPPTIPFWLGEAPARTAELSFGVSRLRENLAKQLSVNDVGRVTGAVVEELSLSPWAAEQLVNYLAAARTALGVLPTQQTIVMERFFDETGATHLVIHSPHGGRINRAWGLALRKRFCRKFNFELQAAATEDAIVLSLSASHSFPLEEVARYLHSKSVREVLIQALLDAPMFTARWRWNATVALAIPRFRGGNKIPPQLQRMDAEDLIAAVFPDQIACAENLVGDREIPDHPLVTQTVGDCLHEAMDVEGLERLLQKIEAGEVQVIAKDLVEPSPLTQEILSARPYAFLDDAPLEERRTQAVLSRRWLDPESASDLGRLDEAAITRVREEVWPDATNADELHDALMTLGFLTDDDRIRFANWRQWWQELAASGRATRLSRGDGESLWIAAERLPEFELVFSRVTCDPGLNLPKELRARAWTVETAILEIIRSRLECSGPVTAEELAVALGISASDIEVALLTLEGEGFAMRGAFTPGAEQTQWCERRLLQRVHRYTITRLRQEIEPVALRDFMRYLMQWQRVTPEQRAEGADALAAVISQLEGFEAPAGAWETELLPARVSNYDAAWLDELSLSGRVAWMRLSAPKSTVHNERSLSLVRTTPIALLVRRNLSLWKRLAHARADDNIGARAHKIADYLATHGASFFHEMADACGLLKSEVEDALGELVAHGAVSSDSFGGLRALLLPSDRRRPLGGHARRRRTAIFGIEDAGRWSLLRRDQVKEATLDDTRGAIEHVAWTLLRRYGVVFWRLLAREADWLPPWRELLRCYRRLEARGEIRGGRFVAGMTGEQFALPDAVGLMRNVRRQAHDGRLISLSATDPLNLLGVLLPGAKLPAAPSNRVLYRDAVPIALLVAGEMQFLEVMQPAAQWEAKNALLRTPSPELLSRTA